MAAYYLLQRVWGRSHLSLVEKIDTYLGLIPPKVGPLIICDNQSSQQKKGRLTSKSTATAPVLCTEIDAISVIFSGSSLFEFDFYFVREGDETDNFTQYHLFHFTFSEYFKVALGITKDKEAKNRKGGAHLGFFFISLLRLGVLTALQ